VNLAAPDSPRWNDYFVDLALATGATPVSRLSPRQVQLDAWLAGPPLKLAQLLMPRHGASPGAIPDPMPPGLLRLWRQHILLDPSAAGRKLGVDWTPYPESLRSSAAWFREKYQHAERRLDKPLWTH